MQVIKIFLTLPCLVSVVWGQTYSPEEIAARNTEAYPISRLHQDWIYQDAPHGDPDFQQMAQKVFEELGKPEKFATAWDGKDTDWKELYFSLCEIRRAKRLQVFEKFPREYLFVKHFVFGDAQAMFAMTDHLTDAIFRERGKDYRMGSSLCKLTVHPDGTVKLDVLLDCPNGVIRDPSLSLDGKTLAFSMRKTDENGGDDFHLYCRDMNDGTVRQITFGPGTADMEPEWLSNGNLVFTSTRCVVSAPCFWSSVCNLYTCDSQGRYIRRLGVDHAHTVFPHLMGDGRILYTRWEYADRTQGYLHSLFVMNADGTNQTEYYGNGSLFPSAILHARSIPGTSKVLAIEGAHHTDQRGKLILIDQNVGTQAGEGIVYLAPEKPYPYREMHGTAGAITHGTDGPQFQYPWPLDESNYVVCFMPESSPIRDLKGIHKGKSGYPAFGIYWMNREGKRELLAYDPVISCEQPIVNAARPRPIEKGSTVDETQHQGTFYVQNVYFGPGLEGITKGTVKKLRVVALDYRTKGTMASALHPCSGHQTAPCAVPNGSWDVKHVLGTVNVEEDGSCFFECPSRVPVFFQLLDERGHMVQNMRSWTMLLPGETFACVGCHENKNSTYLDRNPTTLALTKPPQKILPFFAQGEEPVPEWTRFFTEQEKQAMAYLGTNAPQGMDVPRGFSYRREIQPIWDAHCIQCHAGTKNPEKKEVPLSLLGDSLHYTNRDIYGRTKWRLVNRNSYRDGTRGKVGRDFSESYLELTDYGYNAFIPLEGVGGRSFAEDDKVYLAYFGGDPKKVPDPGKAGYSKSEYAGKGIVNWLHVSAGTTRMLPPYSYGSSQSRLMAYLEPSHYGVRLTPEEKERVACWIDLNVPYCGSWMEANTWNLYRHDVDSGLSPWYVYRDKMREVYQYFEMKRLRYAEVECDHLAKYVEHQKMGKDFALKDFMPFTFGGQEVQKQFIADCDALVSSVPIVGKSENRIVDLAANPDAYAYHLRSYPRAISNSHFKYRPEYSPANVVNGSEGYWRPLRQTDAWLTVELGRKVESEKIVIRLHLEPGQTKTWTGGTLEFSNGFKVPVELKCTAEPQEFTFPKQIFTWVRLANLQETFPLVDNGIAEVRILGKDVPSETAVKNP